MKPSLEYIYTQETLLAIIIREEHHPEGIEFFTPNDFSHQLAFMHYSPGKNIPAHYHNPVSRQVTYTQEVLFIREGCLRVDFYNTQQQYLESRLLYAGDVILLVTGGHGFEVIEEIEMIEVKQGPYLGERDKTRFAGINSQQAMIVTSQ